MGIGNTRMGAGFSAGGGRKAVTLLHSRTGGTYRPRAFGHVAGLLIPRVANS